MPEESSTLEVLARVPTEAEASLIVQTLADRGISAKAIGGFTSGFKAEAPGDVSVLVRRGDLRRAESILAAVRQDRSSRQATDGEADQSTRRAHGRGEEDVRFLCEECGESIVFPAQRRGHVETCPNCGDYVDVPDDAENSLPAESKATASQLDSGELDRPESPGSGLRTSTQLWLEVLAVLCLAYFPDLLNAIAVVKGWVPADYPRVPGLLSLVARSLGVAMPLLVIVALSKDPWRLFGIVRPRWILDGVGGCALWLGSIVAHEVAMCLLTPSMLESSALPHTAHRAGPEGIAVFFLAMVASVANAFAEELVMRGYLIARLERLLRSTWQAVLVTTVLFASYHVYQGLAGAVGAAAIGFVLAVSFCVFRRLWPLWVAHAIWDIWAF